MKQTKYEKSKHFSFIELLFDNQHWDKNNGFLFNKKDKKDKKAIYIVAMIKYICLLVFI